MGELVSHSSGATLRLKGDLTVTAIKARAIGRGGYDGTKTCRWRHRQELVATLATPEDIVDEGGDAVEQATVTVKNMGSGIESMRQCRRCGVVTLRRRMK